MSYNKREYVVKEEQMAAYLADTLKKVTSASDEEIKALDSIKKIIKKNVPLTRRNYVFAYLLKNGNINYSAYRTSKENRNDKKAYGNDKKRNFESNRITKSAKPADNAEKAPRVQINPDVAETIFIGIGRNRSVFPRDLVGLLVSVAELDRSRIGEIRVLSNYSFVQIFKEDADQVISKLNGYEYRGRKLQVSFSRKKDEAASENTTAAEPQEEKIPAGISNTGHADNYVNNEEKALQDEQLAFARSQVSSTSEGAVNEEKQFSETTDDGQVKSHFGNGAAY